jgi:hypothetical protein
MTNPSFFAGAPKSFNGRVLQDVTATWHACCATRRHGGIQMADKREKPSYLDENLGQGEREAGRTRHPTSANEKDQSGKTEKDPTLDPDRPDEFGDGDRRS